MEISIDLDSKSWALIHSLADFEGPWHEHMYHNLPEKLAKESKEYFKPMLHVRQVNQTGRLERSIRYEVDRTGDGWRIDWYGLFYGLYIDTGNFSPGEIKYAIDYEHPVFPLDKGRGSVTFAKHIHGMGYANSNVPTHYSEKTVDWLAKGKAADLALEELVSFLVKVIT